MSTARACFLAGVVVMTLVLLSLAYSDPANQPCSGAHREDVECK